MGIYCYTLRKNPIVALESGAPIQIGYFKYAYKYSWMTENPAYARAVGRSHSQAKKARKANPNLTLVTIGDPRAYDYSNGPLPVHEVSERLDSFMDSMSPGKLAGYLHKSGKAYLFQPLA